MSNLIAINEENFETEVLKATHPVLIDFWAIWCGPCKMIAPIVDELARDYEGQIKVGKCDVDSNQSIAIKYGIRSIPTLLLFKNGQVVDQIIGAVPKHFIKEKIDKALAA